MTQKANDFNAFIATSQRFFAPFVELNQLAIRNFERVARQSYEAAGDALELSLAQTRTALAAKDPQQMAAKTAELANEFIGKQTKRGNELAKLAAGAQAEFGKWVESANEELNAAVRKSA